MIDTKDWHFLASNMPSDEMEKQIAMVLRGKPSDRFLHLLANFFDPPQRRSKGRRATITRSREGRPSGYSDALGVFMADGRERGESLDQLVADAEKLFGRKRRACLNAMEREREHRELWQWLQEKERSANND